MVQEGGDRRYFGKREATIGVWFDRAAGAVAPRNGRSTEARLRALSLARSELRASGTTEEADAEQP